jgi:large subunit ribosomal protein L3
MSKHSLINKGILGKKLGNGQIFNEDGVKIPVTVVETMPCYVVQKKTEEKDGYKSIQLGAEDKKEKNLKKPILGHFKKAKVKPKRHLKELRFCDEVYETLNVGDKISSEQFSEIDFVDVTSTSKGKGFAGVMKKYNYAGFVATHGTHESFRGPGSIGMCAYPGRVIKGTKLPGQMGNKTVTTQNLKVVKVDKENNLLFIKGTIPGSKNSTVIIRDSVKKPSLPFYLKKNEEKKENKEQESKQEQAKQD